MTRQRTDQATDARAQPLGRRGRRAGSAPTGGSTRRQLHRCRLHIVPTRGWPRRAPSSLHGRSRPSGRLTLRSASRSGDGGTVSQRQVCPSTANAVSNVHCSIGESRSIAAATRGSKRGIDRAEMPERLPCPPDNATGRRAQARRGRLEGSGKTIERHALRQEGAASPGKVRCASRSRSA